MTRALLVAALCLGALPSAARAADAADLFRKKCATCHGADGAGSAKNLPDLAAPAVQGKSDQELFDAVGRGTSDRKMPGFRGKLSDAELRALVAHLRGLKR